MINIVVVNDDGWGTAGIRLLAKEMTKLPFRPSSPSDTQPKADKGNRIRD